MSDKKPQIEKFREAAREIKADQSEAAFQVIVTKIANAPKLSQEQIRDLVKRRTVS